MKVQNLTSDLNYVHKEYKTYPHVRFNPSIVHFTGNIYFMCYRLFIPYNKLKTTNVPSQWRLKWSSKLDTTIFCILKYTNKRFQVLKEYDLNAENPRNVDNPFVDTRIVKSLNDEYILTFNTWTKSPTAKVHSQMKDCIGTYDCTYIAKANLILKDDEFMLSKFKYPCLNLNIVMPKSNRCFEGQREEKNWVMWYDGNRENMSYFVEPHIVFKVNKNNNQCKIVGNTSSGSFKKISMLYKSARFLLGTPPIIYNDDEYIAVGHFKYNYKKTTILKKSDLKDKILHFNKSCSDNPGHLIYMMYFYTFSKKAPYEITRVSHAFIPSEAKKYLLTFPMGITKLEESKFVISYGEGDVLVKLLTMNRKEIESLLMDYKTLDPTKFKFMKV